MGKELRVCVSQGHRPAPLITHPTYHPPPPLSLASAWRRYLRQGHSIDSRLARRKHRSLNWVRSDTVRFGSVRWVRVCPILSGQFYLFAIRSAVSRAATATTTFKYHVGGR